MSKNFTFEQFVILWLAALLLIGEIASGDPILGVDILALAKQDIKMLAQNINSNSAIGVLEGTFGPAIPPLEKLIIAKKPQAFRAHLTNGTCFRNRVCEAGEPAANDFKAMRRRAIAFENLHQKYPAVTCYLSPRLEHDEKNKELVSKWFQIIKDSAPSCVAVCSAFTGYCPTGVLIEKHGNSSKGDVVSNDGADGFQTDVQKYLAHGKILSLFWTPRMNLRLDSDKSFTPPSKRTEKLRKDDIIHINRLFEPVQEVPSSPKVCSKTMNLSGQEIGKPRSEDYGEKATDRRSATPLLIAKVKVSKFNIYSTTNRIVACAKYFGPFNGLNRYYVGSCSGDNAVTLMDKLGNEWGFWEDNHKCYLYNSIRRSGIMK